MAIFIISVVAALASLLTFFSGFGLGTILTPVLILFFPIEIANLAQRVNRADRGQLVQRSTGV